MRGGSPLLDCRIKRDAHRLTRLKIPEQKPWLTSIGRRIALWESLIDALRSKLHMRLRIESGSTKTVS